jgi:hypothetical protein
MARRTATVHVAYESFPEISQPVPEVGRIPMRSHRSHHRPPRPDLHVEPNGTGWSVRAEGDRVPCFIGPSRHEAFVWACDMARRSRTCVLVHRTDGRVLTEIDLTDPGADLDL